jgi:hypothetical protein
MSEMSNYYYYQGVTGNYISFETVREMSEMSVRGLNALESIS